MQSSLIVSGESFIKNNTRPRCEGKSNKKQRRGKDRKWKWLELKDRQKNAKDFKKRKKNGWRPNSGETWWKSLLDKTKYSSLLSKSEGWKSKNTKEKSKGYGKNDYLLTALKRSENSKSTPKTWRIQNGKKSKSREKRKDFSNSTCLISRDSCRRSWLSFPTPSASKSAPSMEPSLTFDLNINIYLITLPH